VPLRKEKDMAQLRHEGKVVAVERDGFRTQVRGSNCQEYELYLDLADDGKGNDFTTGKPLKTYEEWLNS